MELNWTRFVLEVINFLVLVWLLKRLFYAPVMRAIAARRAAVEKTLTEAESAKREAANLESTYQQRQREWDQGKQSRREELGREIEEERQRLLQQLEDSMAAEREKAEAREERRKAEHLAREEKQAMSQALEFTSRLLKEVASPELEGRIVEMVIQHIGSPSAEDLRSAAELRRNGPAAVQVRSAYPLPPPRREALSAALKQWLGAEAEAGYETDETLVAGVEISVGAYVLRANLRDELEYFAGTRDHE